MESISVRLLPRRPKGRFHELPARIPITRTASASRKPVLSLRPQTLGSFPDWGQASGLCVLGIVGLALAVVLWGYGYRLSLYHRNAAPSARIPVAKLWIEPRSASAAATSRLKINLHLPPGSQALSVRIPRLPSLTRAAACIPPLNECCAAFVDLLIPSRAPPPLRFLLA
jgi:hypothetical protein